jgi:hypothetical protein
VRKTALLKPVQGIWRKNRAGHGPKHTGLLLLTAGFGAAGAWSSLSGPLFSTDDILERFDLLSCK